MARRFFRRYCPHPDRIRASRVLRVFGTALHRPDLWHLNRQSVARAFAVGLFWAMIPMPLQMVPAAACAIRFRANLPLSVALVWLSNPLTMPPLYLGTYLIGRALVGDWGARPADEGLFRQFMDVTNWLDWRWITGTLASIGVPLYAGSLVAAAAVSFGVYWVVRLLWERHARRRWRRRSDAVAGAAAAARAPGASPAAGGPLRKSA